MHNYLQVIFCPVRIGVYICIMGAIYLSELTQSYFPKSTPRSAVSQLRRWILQNRELRARLDELHFKPRQRALTPLQHEAILKYLGEP